MIAGGVVAAALEVGTPRRGRKAAPALRLRGPGAGAGAPRLRGPRGPGGARQGSAGSATEDSGGGGLVEERCISIGAILAILGGTKMV